MELHSPCSCFGALTLALLYLLHICLVMFLCVFMTIMSTMYVYNTGSGYTTLDQGSVTKVVPHAKLVHLN